MGVRLYDAGTGRFLSVDPIYGGNANAYEYCVGDPVNCSDLTGKARLISRSYSFWSPVWWVAYHFNKSETTKIAWGAGAAWTVVVNTFSKIKAVNKGWAKVATTVLEWYLAYFALTAGYAAARGKCVGIGIGGRKRFASWTVRYATPPVIWVRKC
ncbi:RHS repeat-associated core domain-containing protein [Streptomyces sp. NPDC002845]